MTDPMEVIAQEINRQSGSPFSWTHISSWSRKLRCDEAREMIAALAADGKVIVSKEQHNALIAYLTGFLVCPEIADCAPEDKDMDTIELEANARAMIKAAGGYDE